MKRWLVLTCALGAIGPTLAQTVQEYAPVLSTVPVMQQVAVPRQVCTAGRCSTQNFYETRAVAYRVTYLYGDREYTVQLPYDPGTTVTLQSDAAQLGEVGAPAPAVVVAQPQPVYVPAPVVVAAPPVVYYGSTYYPWRPYPVYPSVGLYLRFGGGHRHHHHHHRH